MSEAPQAYPLQWPAGKPRTPDWRRTRAKFGKGGRGFYESEGSTRYEGRRELTVAEAVRRLQGELDRLGAKSCVVSTNLNLRLDGMPRSGQAQPKDPGVAVYFQLKDRPIVLAGDRYDRVADNIAAVAAHIEAMRAMERHGVGSLEQMFAGFTALPPALAPQDWRAILGDPGSLEEAETTYRAWMKAGGHPDAGGSDQEAAAWNAAIALARKYFEENNRG